MMEEAKASEEDLCGAFPRIFERLAQIPGYVWDRSVEPFHSVCTAVLLQVYTVLTLVSQTYDNWHIFGVRHVSPRLQSRTFSAERTHADGSPKSRMGSWPVSEPSPSSTSEPGRTALPGDISPSQDMVEPVVARLSTHILRLEREYHLCKSLLETSDPDCKHVVQPIDFIRLPSQPGDQSPIVISIFKSPGRNYLRDSVNFGPAFYGSHAPRNRPEGDLRSPGEQMSLLSFLDFALGASECLELLHHGQRTVHGELRGDAFHFNKETGVVKLINFGSGPRSFEHGLTSVGWSALSREVGVKNKLQFIAPEQTGRMPAAPDSRTDIYSLGVVFWIMLTGEPAFDGQTPMEIVQSVLSRLIPPVSSKRMDIPDVLSAIIQKMTMKQIDDRYHSASGLKFDILQLQRILGDGDGEALKNFKIATKDISSYFYLPKIMVGRQSEHTKIIQIIEKVSRRFHISRPIQEEVHNPSSRSSISEGRANGVELGDGSSDGTESFDTNPPWSSSFTNNASQLPVPVRMDNHPSSDTHVSTTGTTMSRASDRSPHNSLRPDGSVAKSKISSENKGSFQEVQTVARHNTHSYKRKRRCEVISIAGAAGLGKSCLVQSVQTFARRYGYLASAKFDTAKKEPFEPVLKVMSSLFRQIFSEGDVMTEFHQLIRAYVAPVSALLQVMLDIPAHLLGESPNPLVNSNPASSSEVHDTAVKYGGAREGAAPSMSGNQVFRADLSALPTSNILRGGSSSKSLRFSSTFLDLLRLLSLHKFICLCFDDLQFADEESLELISSIVAANIGLVVIVSTFSIASEDFADVSR